MDIIPLLIFLGIAWMIFGNVKAAGKGLDKAAKTDAPWRDNISTIQQRLKEHAARDEFEVSPELKDDWSYETQNYRRQTGQSTFGQRTGPQTPTQRGRERLRRQTAQQRMQQRLQEASKTQAFKQRAVKKAKPHHHGRGMDFGLNSRHAPQKDQNRQRRDDWGTRGGEIITTQSLLVLLALGLIVLYVLSKVTPSDVGL